MAGGDEGGEGLGHFGGGVGVSFWEVYLCFQKGWVYTSCYVVQIGSLYILELRERKVACLVRLRNVFLDLCMAFYLGTRRRRELHVQHGSAVEDLEREDRLGDSLSIASPIPT